MHSIANIRDFLFEHEKDGGIDGRVLAKKIRAELSTLSKQDLLRLSETLLFKDLAEEFFTEETLEKILGG